MSWELSILVREITAILVFCYQAAKLLNAHQNQFSTDIHLFSTAEF